MHFNVSQLMREPSGSSRNFVLDHEFAPTDDGELQRITGPVKLLKTDQGVWVSAALKSSASCVCSRCLREHWQSVHMTIDEEFFPQPDPASGVGIYGLDVEAESFVIDQSHILDLTETVKQYLALNLPMKPVCRNDCKGICMNCGADLNNLPCQCDPAEMDSRWGQLIDLVSAGQPAER